MVSTANVPFTESDVAVVVMIATLDGNGDSSDDRKFSFYCTRLYASCTSVRAQKKKSGVLKNTFLVVVIPNSL